MGNAKTRPKFEWGDKVTINGRACTINGIVWDTTPSHPNGVWVYDVIFPGGFSGRTFEYAIQLAEADDLAVCAELNATMDFRLKRRFGETFEMRSDLTTWQNVINATDWNHVLTPYTDEQLQNYLEKCELTDFFERTDHDKVAVKDYGDVIYEIRTSTREDLIKRIKRMNDDNPAWLNVSRIAATLTEGHD